MFVCACVCMSVDVCVCACVCVCVYLHGRTIAGVGIQSILPDRQQVSKYSQYCRTGNRCRNTVNIAGPASGVGIQSLSVGMTPRANRTKVQRRRLFHRYQSWQCTLASGRRDPLLDESAQESLRHSWAIKSSFPLSVFFPRFRVANADLQLCLQCLLLI